jgi:cobalt/nickel transport protein
VPERKKKLKTLALHALLFIPLLFTLFYLTLAPREWKGVDEAVVEKIAAEHGREAKKPLIDLGEGDILLFAFLCAGAVGGFAAGYWWRMLVGERAAKGGRENSK